MSLHVIAFELVKSVRNLYRYLLISCIHQLHINFICCAVVAFQGVDTLTLTSMRTLVSKLVAPEDQGKHIRLIA